MSNYLNSIGMRAKIAFSKKIDKKAKNKVLVNFISILKKNKKNLIKENLKDINFAKKKGLKSNLINRLTLDENKIDSMIKSIKEIIKFKDPTYEVISKWKRPNGLMIKKVSVPIGVIGLIYESRPNVTSDVSSLCFKSGNCVILKGGSEAINSNKLLVHYFRKSLIKNNIDPNYVQLINKLDRKYVNYMLSKMIKYIDVIIPRGGKNLVKKVQQLSKVPIIGHLEGVCHTYVDKDAELNMAIKVIYNAKLRNTSICGATETILLHKKILKKYCTPILNKLKQGNCKIYGDQLIKRYFSGKINLATEKNWGKEYLSASVSVKSVNSCDDAINHINKYGTMHTDAIISKNKKTAFKFLKNIKSSIGVHNASTQFADGGEFGFGGEVGISTNSLPPRGPVGLNQLTSYKYEVIGTGQIRK
ncbi:MAG: glutamate-5-semialdehyde dehydrogenase [Candidatus Pelagibacter sp. TMED275]|mgnify:CR=1 FL=1|nr:MAG: glutamate-5-semialdehyde dehydrogenase [Candidatus Pelagibacter sp. TMED275]|tara:strand:- start:17 stop:1267 length:1251 start_codon:yes stop_codon:yes gene_type:complete